MNFFYFFFGGFPNFYVQTLLFLRPCNEDGSGGTLSGSKKNVYVILKILKLLFGVDLSSFSLKFAVDRALEETKFEVAPIGPSLERALRYHTVRGKLCGIHPDLVKIGITRIEVDFKAEKVCFSF